mmetsp:Transcript_18213/g.40422  ORF Transcript_18213/g.40422 Transcript_18213/m.40422 type:complete len:693 (-) Transcript_18213:1581-3659(-)
MIISVLCILVLLASLHPSCSRTTKDDIKHLSRGNGRVLHGVYLGDPGEIRLGLDEGGSPDAILEPYFGQIVLKLGKAYLDFPACPALHLAINLAQKGQLNAASFLLKKGANPNLYKLPSIQEKDKYDRGFPPALLFGLGLGQEPTNAHAGLLQRLHRTYPAALNLTLVEVWREQSGNPPLLQLCLLLGNVDGAHLLLTEFNASVHDVDAHGVSALHIAAWRGDIPAMVLLLQNGASTTAVDAYSRSPLHYAAMRGNAAASSLLIASVATNASLLKPEVDKIQRRMLRKKDVNGVDPYKLISTLAHLKHVAVALNSRFTSINVRFVSQPAANPRDGAEARESATINEMGWSHPGDLAEMEGLSGGVEMEVADANELSRDRFREKYFSAQRPVLITNHLAGGANIWANLMKEHFVETFGSIELSSGPGLYSSPQGLANLGAEDTADSNASAMRRMTVASYIDSYMRVRGNTDRAPGGLPHDHSAWEGHAAAASSADPERWAWDLPTPDLFRLCGAADREPLQLHLGPALSGAPPLARNASWSLLLVGRRLWFATAPGVDVAQVVQMGHADPEFAEPHPRGPLTAQQWVETVAPALRSQGLLLEVTQYPGDFVFMPHDWQYVTLNLADTVAVSQEFCTFLHTDQRIQPLGSVLYGGDDPHRGLGMYKTHRTTNLSPGIPKEKRSKVPVFDFPDIT